MTKKILLSSIDAPFIGGAGTNSYNLIKLMRSSLKLDVVGLFIYANSSYNNDPHNIGKILKHDPYNDTIEQTRMKIKEVMGGEPDVIVAKNYIAVLICYKIFPNIKIVFLPSGSSFYGHYNSKNKNKIVPMSDLITKLEKNQVKMVDVITEKGNYPCFPKGCQSGCDCEIRAIILSHRIVPNSEITERLFKELIKNMRTGSGSTIIQKIVPYVEISTLYDTIHLNKTTPYIDFKNRKYDVMFACYSWNRKLKNIDLVKKIVRHPQMNGYRILVVGNYSNLVSAENLTNVITKGCQDNDNIMQLYMSSKCFVCPSFYDSFPNVITEANLCNCSTVTSKNVGQWKLLSSELIVLNFNSVDEWVEKIIKGVQTQYPSYKLDQYTVLKKLEHYL